MNMLVAVALALFTAQPAKAQPDPAKWPAVLAEANGQTVSGHASGDLPRISAFIAIVGMRRNRAMA